MIEKENEGNKQTNKKCGRENAKNVKREKASKCCAAQFLRQWFLSHSNYLQVALARTCIYSHNTLPLVTVASQPIATCTIPSIRELVIINLVLGKSIYEY